MTREPLPDGVIKLANTLRAKAENEPDPALKKNLLESADKLEKADTEARRIFAESDALQEKLGKRHSNEWVVWLFAAGLVGIVLFKYLFL
ncbi:MAG: hypothetical protein PHQ60_10510 [Sideroxydans sp.]|nr:hypothetical protein [Sideroxydans sp.]